MLAQLDFTCALLTRRRLVCVGIFVHHQECRLSSAYPEPEEDLGRELRPADLTAVDFPGVCPPGVFLVLRGPGLRGQKFASLLLAEDCFLDAVGACAIEKLPNVAEQRRSTPWVIGWQLEDELHGVGRLIQVFLELSI